MIDELIERNAFRKKKKKSEMKKKKMNVIETNDELKSFGFEILTQKKERKKENERWRDNIIRHKSWMR